MAAYDSSTARTHANFGTVYLEGSHAKVRVNPKIYSLAVVQSAAFSLLDKGYFFIGGDSETGFLVEIWPRKGSNQEDLLETGKAFNDELLNYAVYALQSESNKPLREAILRAAFFAVQQPSVAAKPGNGPNELENVSADDFDPMEIARPWTPDKAPKC